MVTVPIPPKKKSDTIVMGRVRLDHDAYKSKKQKLSANALETPFIPIPPHSTDVDGERCGAWGACSFFFFFLRFSVEER